MNKSFILLNTYFSNWSSFYSYTISTFLFPVVDKEPLWSSRYWTAWQMSRVSSTKRLLNCQPHVAETWLLKGGVNDIKQGIDTRVLDKGWFSRVPSLRHVWGSSGRSCCASQFIVSITHVLCGFLCSNFHHSSVSLAPHTFTISVLLCLSRWPYRCQTRVWDRVSFIRRLPCQSV